LCYKSDCGLVFTSYSAVCGRDNKEYLKQAKKSVVDSRYAKLEYLKNKAKTNNDEATLDALAAENFHINLVDGIFKAFDGIFEITADEKATNIDFDCLRTAVTAYKTSCTWGEYDLKYVRNLALACGKVEGHIQHITETLVGICSSIN